jgi:hypothetical protein
LLGEETDSERLEDVFKDSGVAELELQPLQLGVLIPSHHVIVLISYW